MDNSEPSVTSTTLGTSSRRMSSPNRSFANSQRRRQPYEMPSAHYPDIEAINPIKLKRAESPPRATLPRRAGQRFCASRTRDRNPLTSGLLGPGRAGKYGELAGQSGGRYVGEVLAGRPHGQGQYLVPKGGGRSDEWVVQYEGEWEQGRKEGLGTMYYASGESYTGAWVANVRHGQGRFFFDSGDMYAGEWVDNKRTGHGTLYNKNGDVFVGNFIKDCKEGMGTLYMISRQRKYVAEYVAGSPRCGTVLNIEDEDLEPLPKQLRDLVLAKRLDQAAAGERVAQLPPLELLQPNKVLAKEVVGVRKVRAEGSKVLCELQANSGTLTNKEIEMLRHSYTLMAAGDGPTTGILAHQLRELCVMAGLDPASGGTHDLVAQLLARKSLRTGRIDFDAFMKTVIHFQDTSKSAMRIEDAEPMHSEEDGMPEDDEQWAAAEPTEGTAEHESQWQHDHSEQVDGGGSGIGIIGTDSIACH